MAIARASHARHLHSAAEEVISAGITCLELPLTTPGVLDIITRLATQYADDALIGAGTVLSASDARRSVEAGARFLVCPNTNGEVLDFAVTSGVACFPGAFTVTEIVTALSLGASGVKLFPASLGGPRYVREIRQPLPHVPLIPTGGIALLDIADYIAAGAIAVGLGTALFGDALESGSLHILATRARQALAGVEQGRETTNT